MADKDKLSDALEAFKEDDEAWSENRQNALEDIKFARLGEQWDENLKLQREREYRPCLTINKLPAFARQVTNEARQNKPSIQVLPASDEADVETASVKTGLIRNIEAVSAADVAYDTGIEHAVYGGFGFWRVDLDYARDDEFELDIMIRRIANQMTVIPWKGSQEADSSDWARCFIVERIPIPEFKKRYKGAEQSDFDSRDYDKLWVDDDSVRVAEWWQREEVTRNVVKLQDGSIIDAAKFQENAQLFQAAGLQVVGERPVKSFKVSQKIITGAEILDEKEWAGRYIPIIPIYGDEVNVEGTRYFRSLIRDAKDSQKQFNYWRTAATELVALAPKVPFIGPRGAFNTDADKWNTINRTSHGYVEFDGPTPPMRQPLDAGVAAGSLQEALTASDDMKAIMGIYDSSLGQRSNETSGIAIRRRQHESDVGNFHFQDNQSRAVRHTGRVILDLIPTVYTGDRIIRILGEDNAPQNVPLGKPTNWKGMLKTFDLTAGKYDCVVKAGPSYGTRREEAAEQMIATAQAFPPLAPMMVDLLAENLDWPGADKLKERIAQQQANPPPNPEMMKAQAQSQVEQMKVQAQTQIEQMKAQTTAQLEQMRSQAEVAKAQAMAAVEAEKEKQRAFIEMQKSAADNEAKAQIEREKLASSERQTAAKIEADRQNQMLALAAGILSARERVRGQNLSNGTTLDQTGAAVDSTNELQGAIGEIATAAGSMEAGGMIPRPPEPPVLAQSATKRKRRSRFAKQPDGSWLAEDL